jgi:hypothetical protein
MVILSTTHQIEKLVSQYKWTSPKGVKEVRQILYIIIVIYME